MSADDHFQIPVTVFMPRSMLARIQGVARRHEADVGPLIVELCRRQLILGGTIGATPTGGDRGGRRGTRRYWDTSLDNELRRLHAEFKNDKTIGDELGYSSSTIGTRRRELGLEAYPHHPWTPAHDERLRELHSRGWSDNRIAKDIGFNRKAIAGHRETLGLPRLHESRNPSLRRPDPVLAALAEGVPADAS